MRRSSVFVDTGAWFALKVRSDRHHQQSARTLRALVAGGHTLVTSNHVIGETYTLLRSSCGYREAAAFLDKLRASARLEGVFVSNESEQRAFELLARFREHDFSFVDATRFAVMRSAKIMHAFAFDAHFATAGFTRIPVDLPADQV